jgi:hypothetical protein
MRDATEGVAQENPWRRLRESEAQREVEHWRAALGVRQPVRLERIRRHQVTDEHGSPGCSLVGVVHDAESACIYHTRALTPEDIVHELLHVANPAWTEAQVVAETDRLLSWQPLPGLSPSTAAAPTRPSGLEAAGHAHDERSAAPPAE